MLRAIFMVAATAALLYLAADIPLGQRTLGEHVRRIWTTPAALDLRADLKREGARAQRELRSKLEAKLDELRRRADGGAAGVPGASGRGPAAGEAPAAGRGAAAGATPLLPRPSPPADGAAPAAPGPPSTAPSGAGNVATSGPSAAPAGGAQAGHPPRSAR